MAIYTENKGTQTIGTTEYSIAQSANYSAGSPKTTPAYVEGYADFLALAAGDRFQMTVYERVNGGTQAPVITPIVIDGAQGQHWVTPRLLLLDGWDITIKKLAGNDCSVKFSVRMDTGDVNVVSIANAAIVAASFAANAITSTVIAANAIGASQIAALAITAGKFATDAIDGAAVAASAVTKIQNGLALAATALSNGTWTNGRAALLDNLNAAVNTLALAATAVSSADLTPARAAKLDQLDAAVTSRATPADVTSAVVSAVAGAAAGIAAASAAAVWSTVSEVGETAGDAIRNIAARLLGSGTVRDGDGAYLFLSRDGSKTRVAQTRAGTVRTTTTRDGT